MIIYNSQISESFHRAVTYKNQFPKEEFWLVADEKESPLLLKSQSFQEIILLPEVKEQKKEILHEVTTPTKIRLLSEKYFNQQQEKVVEKNHSEEVPPVAEKIPSAQFTPRKSKRKKKKLGPLLLGLSLLVLVVLIWIFIF